MFLLMCSEWGDESQLVTIGLSTQYSVLSIILGGGLAQAACVLVAMGLGKCLQGFLSKKTFNLITGVIFLVMGTYESYNLYTIL